jgi:hypothetical protein
MFPAVTDAVVLATYISPNRTALAGMEGLIGGKVEAERVQPGVPQGFPAVTTTLPDVLIETMSLRSEELAAVTVTEPPEY